MSRSEPAARKGGWKRRLRKAAVWALCAGIALLLVRIGARLAFGVRDDAGWPAGTRVALDERLPDQGVTRGTELFRQAVRSRVRTCDPVNVALWLDHACREAQGGASPPTHGAQLAPASPMPDAAAPPGAAGGGEQQEEHLQTLVRDEVAANHASLQLLRDAATAPYWSSSAAAIGRATTPAELQALPSDLVDGLVSLCRLACADAVITASSGNVAEALSLVDTCYCIGVNLTQGALAWELFRASVIVQTALSTERAVLSCGSLPPDQQSERRLRKSALAAQIWPFSETVRLEGCRNLRLIDLVASGGSGELRRFYSSSPRHGWATAWGVLLVSSPRDTRAWASDRYARLVAASDSGANPGGFDDLLMTRVTDLRRRRDYFGLTVACDDLWLRHAREARRRMRSCLLASNVGEGDGAQ